MFSGKSGKLGAHPQRFLCASIPGLSSVIRVHDRRFWVRAAARRAEVEEVRRRTVAVPRLGVRAGGQQSRHCNRPTSAVQWPIASHVWRFHLTITSALRHSAVAAQARRGNVSTP